MMNTLLQDVRYAVRKLRASPGFTAAALASLALGIGATTAIFSVVNGVLLKPLPYEDPNRLVMVWEHNVQRGWARHVVSSANFFAWSEQGGGFEHLAAVFETAATITGGGEPERVGLVLASASLFPILAVQPAIGRAYTPEEDREGAPRVAVIGYGFWQRRFGGDRGVIGRTLTLDGQPVTVIGVLPDGFAIDIPVKAGGTGTQDVWVPFQFGAGARTFGGRWLGVFGRLSPGVTIQQAQVRMSALARQLALDFPERQTGWDVNIVPLDEQLVGNVRKALLLIFGAVTLVLLIACANVANLLLSRAIDRRQELTLRAALGASRSAMVRQLLIESLVLAGIGGALGAWLAWGAVQGLVSLAPNIPRLEAVSVDGTVLGFALLASLITGLLFGLVPALRTSRVELGAALKEGGTRGGSGVGVKGARNGLVIAEVGLSIVLLVGAALLIRSLTKMVDVGIGIETERLVLSDLQLPEPAYPNAGARARAIESLVQRVQALPGVQSASAITFPPLSGGTAEGFWVNDRPIPAAPDRPTADIRWVHRDYHRTLGISLLAGRLFDATDREGAPLRVVVSRRLAETFWPGESAVGKSISMAWATGTLVAEIIGVVEDIRYHGPRTDLRPMIYWHFPQFQPFNILSLVVRTTTDQPTIGPALRGAVQTVDPNLPIYNVRTMQSAMAETLARARLATISLGSFALIALILAGVGVYSVLAYSVSQRTREFGIRMAVGAAHQALVALVLKEGLRLVAIGLIIGTAAALGASRLMRGLVFDIGTTDPLSFLGAATVLAAVALLASYLPARRATRVDPMVALRNE